MVDNYKLYILISKYNIMKNLKKVSRSQMKSINGGSKTCSEACCPTDGRKRCPWVICVAPCEIYV